MRLKTHMANEEENHKIICDTMAKMEYGHDKSKQKPLELMTGLGGLFRRFTNSWKYPDYIEKMDADLKQRRTDLADVKKQARELGKAKIIGTSWEPYLKNKND